MNVVRTWNVTWSKNVLPTICRGKWNKFYIQYTGIASRMVLWLNKSKKMIHICFMRTLKVVVLKRWDIKILMKMRWFRCLILMIALLVTNINTVSVFFSKPLLTMCYIAVTAHAHVVAGLESCIWCKYLYPPPNLKTFFSWTVKVIHM